MRRQNNRNQIRQIPNYDYKDRTFTNTRAPVYQPQDKTKLLRLDADIVEGAKMFVECSWFWPAMTENDSPERSSKPHSHDYDEIIGMVGTNTDDLYDLGAECEMTLNGEKNIVTKSRLIYLPAGFEPAHSNKRRYPDR